MSIFISPDVRTIHAPQRQLHQARASSICNFLFVTSGYKNASHSLNIAAKFVINQSLDETSSITRSILQPLSYIISAAGLFIAYVKIGLQFSTCIIQLLCYKVSSKWDLIIFLPHASHIVVVMVSLHMMVSELRLTINWELLGSSSFVNLKYLKASHIDNCGPGVCEVVGESTQHSLIITHLLLLIDSDWLLPQLTCTKIDQLLSE